MFLQCLYVLAEYPIVKHAFAEFTVDPVGLMAKFFKLCHTQEFLENPTVCNLLEALSGQHKGSCFFQIVYDTTLPKCFCQLKPMGKLKCPEGS